MRTQVQKWGNSLAVRIPKAFARDLGIDLASAVELTIEDGALILKPASAAKYQLQELLDQVSEANLHTEASWGAPQGSETW